MNKKSSTFISGIFAVGIYFFAIGVILFYFNSHEFQKPIHYVKKNEDRIRVTMSAPKNKVKIKKKQSVKKKTTYKKKPVVKKKAKDSIRKQKDTHKKVIKEKIVKKVKKKSKKIVKKVVPKKVNKPKDLFANISSRKKTIKPKKNNFIKVSDKTSASDLVSSSLKIQKKSDRGVENAYFALVEEKLKGWPAQSEYAGEMAKVWFKIDTKGYFIFKVTTASANEDFNTGLVAYLKQLQRIGFGSHNGKRAYTLNVEFVATE
ncbi:Genomic DNA, chromosome 3, BAC clone:F1D9 [hydrothermal vent metagenome]|uniref:Genomic DNA, chromosome 3, BAC clone:F1D9 n=1 Tax=hydrothermal vent metagenome TaxID=652676 RepID=A0A1W1BCT2_9ZZZZ